MSLFRFVQWISEGHSVLVYGNGQQSRDFTYVDDIARGTIAGLKPLGYEIINLGSDTPVVLMDALRAVERLVGKSAQIDFQLIHRADVTATWADISGAVAGLAAPGDHRGGDRAPGGMVQRNRGWTQNIVDGHRIL